MVEPLLASKFIEFTASLTRGPSDPPSPALSSPLHGVVEGGDGMLNVVIRAELLEMILNGISHK